MHLSCQIVVLATLAFENAFAQPSHRHIHQHNQRDLPDVLGKRQDWNNIDMYINPVTHQRFTDVEWNCLVKYPDDKNCYTIDIGSSATDTTPASTPTAPKVSGGAVSPSTSSSAPAPTNTGSITPGSTTDSGPGAHIFNKGSSTQTFIFYENDSNGAGQATNPGQAITLAKSGDQFVSLPMTWKGHVQRGQSNPKVPAAATWAEFQVSKDGGPAWGDISLQKGCDGPAMIISATDTTQAFGFTHDIISAAPAAAKVTNPDGKPALDYTEDGWMGSEQKVANQAAIAWEQQQVGQAQVYIVGGTGTNVFQSANNIVHIEFY